VNVRINKKKEVMTMPNVDSLLCFQGSFGPNLRSLHRSGLQNKELDSAIGVRSPLWTGEKGYIYTCMSQIGTVCQCVHAFHG
jgi:hypothetical protein